MKISIIIPVYNVEQYVVQCLQSVADQTWKDGEIECIVVDDCGTDRSMALVEEFISSYSGRIDFKVVRHERNRGLSAARNTGMDVASGDYIYFIDSDDYIDPNCFGLMAKKVSEHPEVEMVHGTITSIPYREYYDKKALKEISYIGSNVRVRELFYDLSMNATDKLISVDYIKKNNLRFREGIIHEDELWSYYLYRSLSKVAFVQDTTYWHIIHEGSIMTSLTDEHDTNAWALILDELSQQIKDPCASKIELYYLSMFMRYCHYTMNWNRAYKQFRKNIKENNHMMELYVYDRFHKTGDSYYLYWLLYSSDKCAVHKILLLIRHSLRPFCLRYIRMFNR